MKNRKSLFVDSTLDQWLIIANLTDAHTRNIVQTKVRFGIENASLNMVTKLVIENEIRNRRGV